MRQGDLVIWLSSLGSMPSMLIWESLETTHNMLHGICIPYGMGMSQEELEDVDWKKDA